MSRPAAVPRRPGSRPAEPGPDDAELESVPAPAPRAGRYRATVSFTLGPEAIAKLDRLSAVTRVPKSRILEQLIDRVRE